jgi:uroporphyrin-III C-methyltransferase/precorrin-2 dehydrogenase/sirohydrochlorin ferrochelatase
LTTLPELAEHANLRAPTLIIVGEVVTLRDKLRWFEESID